MTAQTQIIQTTAEAHAEALSNIIDAHVNMSEATGSIPTSPDKIGLYCSAYDAGWNMATYFILSRGNCKFERSE